MTVADDDVDDDGGEVIGIENREGSGMIIIFVFRGRKGVCAPVVGIIHVSQA